MDFLAVHQSAQIAVARARSGAGPTLLEYKTYRYRGHSRGDPCGYRDKEEFQQWSERDPIDLLRTQLQSKFSVTLESLSAIEAECQDEVERALEFALQSPEPHIAQCTEHVFAERRGSK
jgi:pyruvate dehydrogenase E1 component alpha subunit